MFIGSCSSYEATNSPPAPANPGLLIIAHGNGGRAGGWPARMIRRIEAVGLNGWDLHAVDWEEGAGHVLTASRSGTRIGRDLAHTLVEHGDPYRVIHLIGQSLGAFVVQGFVDGYTASGGRALIHTTFLDPFLIRGIVGFGYGVRHFGRGSDFAENYVVLHDHIPGTNRSLKHAFNFELDALVPQSIRERGGHFWPVNYYRDSIGAETPGFSLSPVAHYPGGPPGLSVLESRFERLAAEFPPGDRSVPGLLDTR